MTPQRDAAARRRERLLLPVCLLAAGCSTPKYIAGEVRAMPDTCDVRAGAPPPGALIPGATLRLRCPGGRPGFSIASDAGGKVRYAPEEAMPNGCELVVEKPGYAPRVYAIEELCAEESFEPHPFWTPEPPPACASLSLSARLVKLSGATPETPAAPVGPPAPPPFATPPAGGEPTR